MGSHFGRWCSDTCWVNVAVWDPGSSRTCRMFPPFFSFCISWTTRLLMHSAIHCVEKSWVKSERSRGIVVGRRRSTRPSSSCITRSLSLATTVTDRHQQQRPTPLSVGEPLQRRGICMWAAALSYSRAGGQAIVVGQSVTVYVGLQQEHRSNNNKTKNTKEHTKHNKRWGIPFSITQPTTNTHTTHYTDTNTADTLLQQPPLPNTTLTDTRYGQATRTRTTMRMSPRWSPPCPATPPLLAAPVDVRWCDRPRRWARCASLC